MGRYGVQDMLDRVLDEIAETKSMQSDELTIVRVQTRGLCEHRRRGLLGHLTGCFDIACHNDADFEVRGAVHMRVCARCLSQAAAHFLTPMPLADDMELHIGRHSSIVTRIECTYRPNRLEGMRPEPITNDCFMCAQEKGKPKPCRGDCGRRTTMRCSCLAAVCRACYSAHSHEAGAGHELRCGGIA